MRRRYALNLADTVKMLAGCDYSQLTITYQPLENTPVGNVFLRGKMSSGTTVSINFYPDSGITAERAVLNSGGNTQLHYEMSDSLQSVKIMEVLRKRRIEYKST